MIRFKVNGKEKTFDGDPDMPLLWYLRDVAGLTGTKFGCGISLCGACTVHQNGQAIRSCGTTMKEVGGSEITTIEGIAPLHPVQKAWMEIKVPQRQRLPDIAVSISWSLGFLFSLRRAMACMIWPVWQ